MRFIFCVAFLLFLTCYFRVVQSCFVTLSTFIHKLKLHSRLYTFAQVSFTHFHLIVFVSSCAYDCTHLKCKKWEYSYSFPFCNIHKEEAKQLRDQALYLSYFVNIFKFLRIHSHPMIKINSFFHAFEVMIRFRLNFFTMKYSTLNLEI